MELVYSTHEKSSANHATEPEHSTIPVICRLSSRNLLAFSTPHEINASSAEKRKFGSYVYVCDIVSPWQVFKVTSKSVPITILEWDVVGKRLLIGDSEGCIEIWTEKNRFISDWQNVYTVRMPGEKVIKVNFFHTGRSIYFTSDKRDHTMYTDKFQRMKFAPSVRKFGGTAADGCLIVTSTGLLGAFVIPQDSHTSTDPNNPTVYPIEIVPVTQSIGLTRNYITTAAVAYAKSGMNGSGHFRVAVTNGDNKHKIMIQCYRVSIEMINEKLNIISQSLPTFFPHEENSPIQIERKVTHLCWTLVNDIDSLLVVEKNPTGSTVALYTLNSKVTPIHKLLQTNTADVFKNITWNHQSSFQYNSSVKDICITKMTCENFYIFVLMDDNTIQMLRRDMKMYSSVNFASMDTTFKSEPLSKLPRIEKRLMAIDITYMSHVLIAIDNKGQTHAFRIPQIYYEQCTNQISLVSHKASLLEYCIVSGYDASDIFLTLRQSYLESILEKLTDNFTRQPSSVQQFYYVNFLTMKTNLYRLLPSGQSKANDLNCLIMLHSILIAFKSLLRPSDLTSHDKGPAENLAMVLSESVPDVDKVLVNLDAKDFTVEPPTLQSLQQLIQWVADLALNILARLPQTSNQMNLCGKSTGYDICKDIVALNSIRELLVMIRIWGLLNVHCLPTFSQSVQNLDVLAILFRLLTRLALNPSEPDELLLDECCLLPNQVLIPRLQFSSSSITSINSPALFLNPLPLHLTYNAEPDILKHWRLMSSPSNENQYNNNHGVVDSVRNLHLGKKPAAVRQCFRCGTCSNIASLAKTTAMHAWEQRWANDCRCGGSWVLIAM